MVSVGNKEFFCATKLLPYKSLILPMLSQGGEAGTLLRSYAAALRVLKRKVLPKTFDPTLILRKDF